MNNFEARLFGAAHQAQFLAGWCAGVVSQEGAVIQLQQGFAAPGSRGWAKFGDWIIRAADGTCRIEKHGNQDGYCTDCGKPVWQQDHQLITRGGLRWCFGKDQARLRMTHHHALPGMAQYVVQAPEGQVCHCLDRAGPHIHQIIMVSS